MNQTELKALIKESLQEVLAEGKIQDPTKEEMMHFLQQQFGRYGEEGFHDSAEVAIYWFANHYHGGQSSNLYSVLSTSQFSPGPISRGPEPDSMEADMYQALEAQYGGKEHQHGQELHHPGEGDDFTDALQEDGSTCQKCKGQGSYVTQLKNHGGKSRDGMGDTHFVVCDAPGCKDGKVDRKEYYRQMGVKEDGTGAGAPEQGVTEMTGTGAVAGYSTPHAFKKKKFNEDGQPEPYDAETDQFAPSPRDRTNMVSPKKTPSFTTHYAVSGLEQIPDSTHASKKEALLAAAEFLKGYVTPKSKAAGEKLVKIDNGYAIKHISGGTVAIATVEPKTFHHGASPLAEAPQSETTFERLDQALTAVEEYVIKNRIQVDTAEHPPNEVDPHGIREPFLYGGIPYGQTKQADYKLLAYKGQRTRKYMHVVIYRTEQGRYELNVYTL